MLHTIQNIYIYYKF